MGPTRGQAMIGTSSRKLHIQRTHVAVVTTAAKLFDATFLCPGLKPTVATNQWSYRMVIPGEVLTTQHRIVGLDVWK